MTETRLEPQNVPNVVDALRTVVGSLQHSEPRPQQDQMASWVAEALAGKHPALIQAPTGVGKTFAYLVPAILHGRRVVVATATKALQDQLANHDLPELQKHLDFKFCVLKGRSNYLCLDKFHKRIHKSPKMLDNEPLSYEDLQDWISVSSGERSELPAPLSNRTWQRLSMSSDECPGAKRCEKGKPCLTEQARRNAGQVEVVVANHALYALHVADRVAGVIPEHDVLVLDEGHQVEDTFTTALTHRISAGAWHNIANLISGLPYTGFDDETESLTDSAESLEKLMQTLPETEIVVQEHDALMKVLGEAQKSLLGLRKRLAKQKPRQTLDGAKDTELAHAERVVSTALQTVHAVQTSTPENYVVYADAHRQPSQRELSAAPLKIGEMLASRLWNNTPRSLLTSATLPHSIADTLGMPETTFEGETDSPFDLQTNSRLFASKTMPKPGSAARYALIEQLILAAGGRTLMLFTSKQSLQQTVNVLRKKLPKQMQLLAQYESSNDDLIKQFAGVESSCLFATMTFWEGVDIPGRSCSLVIIDKLPFPVPEEPLINARRRAAGTNGWRRVDLLVASIKLAQGAGRLIRRNTDKGVVAVLDPRLVSAGYGSTLRKAMPAMPLVTTSAEACEFLVSVTSTSVLFGA